MLGREMEHQGTREATVVGLIAIGLWAALALSTVVAGIPPFQLMTLSFGIAFVSGIIILAFRGRDALAKLFQPATAWSTAFFAIFLYHTFYFIALSTVPAAPASLIAYLWPLLIVLFSAFVPGGGRPRLRHLLGALLGFAGAAVVLLERQGEAASRINMFGYFAAFCCAIIWASYSVLNRRFALVPSEMLVGVCGAVALAGAAAHLVLEETVGPTLVQWLAVLFLGIGPTGLAFQAWDYATKHGNVPLLGALSYLAPLISTLLLVLSGQAQASLYLCISSFLIVGGAVLASFGREGA
jgi:drug/metabolite transporter (DMT)-like permease